MECLEGRRCIICNAIISDNNPDGIGSSCRIAFNKAKYVLFMEDKDRRNSYYKLRTEPIMFYFETMFKDTKFRSNFRKQFYPSLIKQWHEKKFISNKQLSIVLGMLDNKREWIEKVEKLEEYIKVKQREMVNDYTDSLEGSERDRLRELTNKMRKSLKEE